MNNAFGRIGNPACDLRVAAILDGDVILLPVLPQRRLLPAQDVPTGNRRSSVDADLLPVC